MILSDQTVLLTGGAGVVGNVMLDYLYTRANSIVVVDKNQQSLSKLAPDYPAASFYACDLANAENVRETQQKASQRWPRNHNPHQQRRIHS